MPPPKFPPPIVRRLPGQPGRRGRDRVLFDRRFGLRRLTRRRHDSRLLQRRLNVLACRLDIGAHVLERVVAFDVVGDVVDLLLEVGHLRFAHRFLELALEVGRHAAHPPRPLSKRAQNARQFLRADHDQRHHADQQELGPRNVEHGNFPAGSTAQCVSTAGPMPVGTQPARDVRTPCFRRAALPQPPIDGRWI